jgi:sugar porter (SP) family MFS transporter
MAACSATALVGLGGFLFGYDIGIVSGVLVMPSFLDTFPQVEADEWVKGFVVTSFLIGGAIGSAASSWLSEAGGRRTALQVGAALFLCGGLAQALSCTLPILLASRWLSGVGIGLTAATVPVYSSELAPADKRGMMISFNQINITGGIMVSFWVNLWLKGITGDSSVTGWQWTGWRIAMLLQCVPAGLLLLGSFWLPRSPRWLVQQNRVAEALETLRLLRDHGAEEELRQICSDNDARVGVAPWSDFIFDPASRRRLVCGVTLQTGQMCSGIDSIMFFGPAIFAQAAPHVHDADLTAQGIAGVINFASTFVAVLYLDRAGRRPLLACGAALQALCMVTLATVGLLYARIDAGSSSGSDTRSGGADDLVIEHRPAGIVCILSIYTFVSAFAWSWGPVVWALCTEIFPTHQRVRGVAITTTTNWLWNICVGQLYPPAQAALGFRIFFVFGAASTVLVWWTLRYAPETNGLSIDQVQVLFEQRAESRGQRERARPADRMRQPLLQ